MVFSSSRRPHNSTLEDEMEVVNAMLSQEDGYLPSNVRRWSDRRIVTSISPSDRRKLVRWCIQVMDFCKLDRSLAETAMNYTDRYVTCPAVTNRKWTRSSYQLVAMTSVYITVKLNASEAMDPMLVSRKLSRGTYSAREIEEQERKMLQGLQWKVNPPTACSFLAHYASIMFRCLPIPVSQQLGVYDFALQKILFNVEHTTGERASVIAFEALRVGLLRECHGADQAQITWALSILPQHKSFPLGAVAPVSPTSPHRQSPKPPLPESHSFETSPRSIQHCLSAFRQPLSPPSNKLSSAI